MYVVDLTMVVETAVSTTKKEFEHGRTYVLRLMAVFSLGYSRQTNTLWPFDTFRPASGRKHEGLANIQL